MRRKRRNRSVAFKAKVAVAAVQGDKTLTEPAEQFDVPPNQLQDRQRGLVDRAVLGELTMERDFLESGLERAHGRGAKR